MTENQTDQNVATSPAAPSANPAPAESSSQMLTLARQATARIVTAAIEATAESADMERAALARKFPALTSLPPAMQIDPQQIRDFTQGPAYQQLVEQYVQGRIEGHLLSRAMDLLGQYLPLLFARVGG